MIYYFKIAVVILLRFMLRILWIFPVKRNRILFVANEGRVYGCNPQYIFEYLWSHFGNSYDYVWCLEENGKIQEEVHVICVKYLSPQYLFYLFTSGVVITNMLIEPFFIKRKGQLVISTWHGGGAYKKGDSNALFVSGSRAVYMNCVRNLRSGQTDYVISSCKAFTDTHHAVFNIEPLRFLPIGMPRNDLFFLSVQDSFRKKICGRLHIDPDKKIILYAPTYRGLWRNAELPDASLDVMAVCTAVCKRFGGEAAFLLRQHPNLKKMNASYDTNKTIDVCDYASMQELLFIADVFITDYSSALWDYSFTYRPGFLFTPDLEEYEATTSLYTPIDLWPYPYAKDMEQLCSLILNYKEEAALEKIKVHHNLLNSYENGTATESICRIIENHSMSNY